jgi:two-component system chemotaxis sensor kinase CheA
LPYYLGAVLSPQGTPIPVLDPHALIQLCQQARPATNTLTAPEKSSRRPQILVVDDSITTRTLEKSILETQGFLVEVAVNGREALTKMRHQAFDLVISDVQMPEMDGLQLLETMKQEPALAGIPVIMVTSLQDDEDRRRGLNLGADAYLIKQTFEQQELLDVIGQLL